MLRSLEKLIKKILKAERALGEVNLRLVNDREMQELNFKFRKKNRPTDVLSFPMNEEGILGDIAISFETARRNARHYGISYQAEMKRLLVHGVLHLLGYDHGRKMREKEERYLA